MSNIAVRIDSYCIDSSINNISRCVAIAVSLSKKFHNVYFFTKNQFVADEIFKARFNVFKLEKDNNNPSKLAKSKSDEEIIELEMYLKKFKIDMVFVDIPNVKAKFIEQVGLLVRRVIHVDDLATYTSVADFILNPHVGAKNKPYKLNPKTQRLILGTDFHPFGFEMNDVHLKQTRTNARDIFIHIAESDPYNLNLPIINMFLDDHRINTLTIHVAISREYKHVNELRLLASKHDNLKIHKIENSILEVLSSSDIAITNSIHTIYQLLSFGIPTISFSNNEFYAPILETLFDSKLIGLVNEMSGIEKNLVKKVSKLILNYDIRNKLSERGKKTVDLLGCERICEILSDFLRS